MSNCSLKSATSWLCYNCKCSNTNLYVRRQTQESHKLQLYLKQEMIKQALLYLLETVKVCVSSINVISHLVLKLLDYIVYLIRLHRVFN